MKKHTIIKADDVKNVLEGKPVNPIRARQTMAKNIANEICQAIIFVKAVEVEEKYFKGVESLDDLKAKYKELVIKNHPDKGGDASKMAEINAEYDEKVKKLAATGEKTKKNTVAEKTAGMTDEEIAAAIAAEFKAVMEKVVKMNLDGVTVELIGSWLWISGETKPIKDELKEAGFRWCPKKDGKPWIWHDTYTVYRSSKGKMTKEDIENKHGCQVLKSA